MTAPAPIETQRSLLKRATALGRSLAWPAIGALTAALLATTARLLGPLAVRSGIDDGITAGDKGAITSAAVVFIGLLLVQYVAQRLAQFSVAWLGERYLLLLRTTLFRHLISLDMGFFSREKAGVLVSRMTNDIESLTEFVEEGAVTFLTSLLTVVGVATVMVAVDWRLAVVVFGIIVVVLATSFVFQRYASRAYRDVRETIGRVLGSLQEGITGVRVVQAFTQEGEQAGAFGRINEDYYEANMRAAKAIAWYFPGVAFLRTVAIGAVLFFGGRRVLDGDLTFGSLVAFLFYLDWFFQPIIMLSHIYNQLQSAVAALGKVFRLFDTAPAVVETGAAVKLGPGTPGAIELDGVGFEYVPGSPVLTGIDLSVAAGERVAVVGETGAGKTTIAKLLLRFYDPTAGSVRVDDVDLRGLTFASRARAISLIPQEGFLFNGTLRDNLRYAKPDADDRQIRAVCIEMGIDDWIDSLPDGLDTEVRERGGRFSAGERQLVALARAFLADPAVIVLDEATSNLDPATEAKVERALNVVLNSRTAVVIAHRLNSAERADRVVMMDGGRIIAEGRHADLVAAGGPYAHLVEVWSRGAGREAT
ncbi:MAG: ABC transporter ATP-binding protein [Acidimicrobiia bacterium]|nr:ABC transporter ATP-binding protein [Acidimicrobiia bacterium]